MTEKAGSIAQKSMELVKPESTAKVSSSNIFAKYVEQLSEMRYWWPEDIEKANREAEDAEFWSV